MKNKRKPTFTLWQARRVAENDQARHFSESAVIESIIEADDEDNVELFADVRTQSPNMIMPSTQETTGTAHIISPDKDSAKDHDDYSVYIVHNFVDGEITAKPKLVEDSLSGITTATSSAGQVTNVTQNSQRHGRMDDYIPKEVRSYGKEKFNNSLLDDDISAISFEKMLTIRDRNAAAKQRMVRNMLAKGSEMNDDSTYVTLDADEWEQEVGDGCFITKQLHSIVMETGKAVYDWAGEPEDYLFGKYLVMACDEDVTKLECQN